MPEFTWLRLIALVAFVGTYVGLALGRLPGFRVDRTGVAIIGATVMVVAGVLPLDKAVAAVDAHTLVLLFVMMIVAAYLRLSGFFHLVTYWAVRRARGPVGLLAEASGVGVTRPCSPRAALPGASARCMHLCPGSRRGLPGS